MATQQLDMEGDFRVRVSRYNLFKAESGSVAVNMGFEILECYDHESGTWVDWRGSEVVCEGSFWIIKKDGTINEPQVESLIAHCGWSGLIGDVTDGKWSPDECQVNVKADVYKNMTRYKASFINGYDAVPGGGNISPEKVREIESSYGAKLRALAANVRGKKAPAGRPTAPSKATPAKPASVSVATAAVDAGNVEVPF